MHSATASTPPTANETTRTTARKREALEKALDRDTLKEEDSSGFRRALAITVVVVGLSGDTVDCCLSSSPITELFVLF